MESAMSLSNLEPLDAFTLCVVKLNFVTLKHVQKEYNL